MKLELIKKVNEVISMRDMLVEYGSDVSPSGLLFCPFHDDENKKSAKYFSDSNKMWCFVERKLYGSYDVMKLMGYSDESIERLVGGDVSNIDSSSDSSVDVGVKFPLVDSGSIGDFRRSGNLGEYLRVLDKYWRYRDKLEVEKL